MGLLQDWRKTPANLDYYIRFAIRHLKAFPTEPTTWWDTCNSYPEAILWSIEIPQPAMPKIMLGGMIWGNGIKPPIVKTPDCGVWHGIVPLPDWENINENF